MAPQIASAYLSERSTISAKRIRQFSAMIDETDLGSFRLRGGGLS
jgi:hypothetical protein